jgi:predicted acylesterase/phospholipase RssA
LAGSVPDEATPAERDGILRFVELFTAAILREGGAVLHGSHPSFLTPLKAAASAFVEAGGAKDALTLVRDQAFAEAPEQRAEIQQQQVYSAVHIIPSSPDPGNPAKRTSLVPLREWMAERSDAVVAVGGRRYGVAKDLAGVVRELDEALRRGKPSFLIGGFGGAAAGLVRDNEAIFSLLRNGLPADQNRLLAQSSHPPDVVERILTQLKLLPFPRPGVAGGRQFRILALDGGGLRGAFSAALLAKWDDMIRSGGGNNLVRNFDLVAGTSTGAILAIGLAVGLHPKQILDFYRQNGPKIFPRNRNLRHWLKSKFESHTLRSTLEKILSTKSLSRDSVVRLVIPTVRAKNGDAEWITTAHSRDRVAYRDMSAVDAALASSAAPTYFDEHEYEGPVTVEGFLDGGVWANNPVLPAIAEAVRYLNVPLERIDVLSVGTTSSEADFSAALGKGKAGWAPESADLFFAAQEQGAARLAADLLSPARFLRINQHPSSSISLDDTEAIQDLIRRGSQAGQDSFAVVRSRFLDGNYAADWRS